MEIRKLNTIRGLAALIVVVSHYSGISGLWNKLLGKGGGQIGLMLFFLLSGFLMGYLYLCQPSTLPNIRKFAAARVARVFPLFLIIAVLSFISRQFDSPISLYNIATSESLLSHLLFVRGTSVLWTIPVEIHFYLLFIGIWILFNRAKTATLLLLAFATLALFWFGQPSFKGTFAGIPYEIKTLHTLPFFFLGTALGLLYKNWQPDGKYRSHWLAFSLLLLLLAYPQIANRLFGINLFLWADAKVMLLIALVFFCAIFLTPDDNWFLANPIGDFLGKISYSLYLLHLPVLWRFKDFSIDHPYLAFFPFLAATLIVSYLSYRFLENPCRSYLRRFANLRVA